jgi:aldehyde dehydrogenase (NAD+)
MSRLDYGSAPEDPGPALTWLEGHGHALGHVIAGRLTDPSAGDSLETLNPATTRPLAQVLRGTGGDIEEAVAAARAAQPAWWALGSHGRARCLDALGLAIQRQARGLALLDSLDTGMTLREARDVDLPLVTRHFHHHAGWARLMEEELRGHEPLGVEGQILPARSPLLMVAWKVAPALATGNAVVVKPAADTPLTALRFAELCLEVGLPAGVVNVVTGDGDTGAALVAHPDVDMISLTGSTGVGRAVRQAAAGSGKRLTLELGGPIPFIVFEDADLDSAVEGAVDALWHDQGRLCSAGARILVQEGVAEAFGAKLRVRMETVRVGDPLDRSVDMGAIVSRERLDRIRALVAEARDGGAEVWQPAGDMPEQGWFHPPTLCAGVSAADAVAGAELLGPVGVLMTFRTPDEGVALANDTRYGLAGSVWSESVSLALQAASAVKTGTVWVNCTNLFDAASSFGGTRESGFGRVGGIEGLREYVKPVYGARAPSVRPENRSLPVTGRDGVPVGEVVRGTPGDVGDAVAAARRAQVPWSARTANDRGRALVRLAETLRRRADELVHRLTLLSGDEDDAAGEVEATVSRLLAYGAWAYTGAGRVPVTPFRNLTLALSEPLGVMGAVCPDERPLLAFVSCVAPIIGLGNTCVVIPSESAPLPAIELVRVMDASGWPEGVLNVVAGPQAELVPTLAAHDDVDGIWYFGSPRAGADVERASIGNLKKTWVSYLAPTDWMSSDQGQGEEFLRRAAQVKTIWIPYGE